MRLMLALALAAAGLPALAAPPPPPPPAVVETEKAFFAALPQFMPAEHSAALKAMIAEDLVVTEEGAPMLEGRDAWLAWREGLGGEKVERFQMLREKFWRDRQGRIVVEETWLPLAKDVFWHPDRPRKLVAYTFKDGRLIRVDYLIALDSVSYLDPVEPG
ncbi:hypothetical protein [Erythrobacter donghaensis]|uniref:hypothetical protein n=1 Tax=Erythrobacter donghaensis TaxID=267135 RepID=UPI000A3CDC07|nr:hypothetical protein [Erythrobacter donghaensis]